MFYWTIVVDEQISTMITQRVVFEFVHRFLSHPPSGPSTYPVSETAWKDFSYQFHGLLNPRLEPSNGRNADVLIREGNILTNSNPEIAS